MPDEVSLNALIPAELKKRFDIACVQRDRKQKSAVVEALGLWIEREPLAQPTETEPGTIDTKVLAGLPVGQIADLRDLAGILQNPPDDSIFRVLKSAVDEALDEYRKKWKSTTKTTSKGRNHRRQKAG